MPRNASGVYALPLGNPVVTNTLISSTWANTTMSDLGSEITNSLDRSGRGSMLAPFKSVDGIAALPGLTFGNEPSMGLWRKATAVLAISLAGLEIGNFQSTGWNGGTVGTHVGPVTGHSSLDLALTGGAMSGQITSTFAGAAYAQSSANVGAPNGVAINNTDNTNAASGARAVFSVGGGSAGDPVIIYDIAGVQDWAIGVDNSDSDRFKISASSALGTSDILSADLAGIVTVGIQGAISLAKFQVLHTSVSIASFDTTNANSGYTTYSTSQVAYGLIGNSKQLSGNNLLDFGIRAERHLELISGGGGTSAYWASGGNMGLNTLPTAGLELLKGAGANAEFVLRGNNAAYAGGFSIQMHSDNDAYLFHRANANMLFATNAIERMRITAAGVIQDGNANELGFKRFVSASVTTGAFAASDSGKCVYATGGVTVPNATMVATDAVSICNTTGAPIIITATITTLTNSATGATGNRTLAAKGICTVVFLSGTAGVIFGSGLT